MIFTNRKKERQRIFSHCITTSKEKEKEFHHTQKALLFFSLLEKSLYKAKPLAFFSPFFLTYALVRKGRGAFFPILHCSALEVGRKLAV